MPIINYLVLILFGILIGASTVAVNSVPAGELLGSWQFASALVALTGAMAVATASLLNGWHDRRAALDARLEEQEIAAAMRFAALNKEVVKLVHLLSQYRDWSKFLINSLTEASNKEGRPIKLAVVTWVKIASEPGPQEALKFTELGIDIVKHINEIEQSYYHLYRHMTTISEMTDEMAIVSFEKIGERILLISNRILSVSDLILVRLQQTDSRFNYEFLD